jgi:hypothetical protein
VTETAKAERDGQTGGPPSGSRPLAPARHGRAASLQARHGSTMGDGRKPEEQVAYGVAMPTAADSVTMAYSATANRRKVGAGWLAPRSVHGSTALSTMPIMLPDNPEVLLARSSHFVFLFHLVVSFEPGLDPPILLGASLYLGLGHGAVGVRGVAVEPRSACGMAHDA